MCSGPIFILCCLSLEVSALRFFAQHLLDALADGLATPRQRSVMLPSFVHRQERCLYRLVSQASLVDRFVQLTLPHLQTIEIRRHSPGQLRLGLCALEGQGGIVERVLYDGQPLIRLREVLHTPPRAIFLLDPVRSGALQPPLQHWQKSSNCHRAPLAEQALQILDRGLHGAALIDRLGKELLQTVVHRDRLIGRRV